MCESIILYHAITQLSCFSDPEHPTSGNCDESHLDYTPGRSHLDHDIADDNWDPCILSIQGEREGPTLCLSALWEQNDSPEDGPWSFAPEEPQKNSVSSMDQLAELLAEPLVPLETLDAMFECINPTPLVDDPELEDAIIMHHSTGNSREPSPILLAHVRRVSEPALDSSCANSSVATGLSTPTVPLGLPRMDDRQPHSKSCKSSPDSRTIMNRSDIFEEAMTCSSEPTPGSSAPPFPRGVDIGASWGVRRSARIPLLRKRPRSYFEEANTSERSVAAKRQKRAEDEEDYVISDDADSIFDEDEGIPLRNSPHDGSGRRNRRSGKVTKTKGIQIKDTHRCICSTCSQTFSRQNDLKRHQETQHFLERLTDAEIYARFPAEHPDRPWCLTCRRILKRKDARLRHEKSSRLQGGKCEDFVDGTKRSRIKKLQIETTGKNRTKSKRMTDRAMVKTEAAAVKTAAVKVETAVKAETTVVKAETSP